MRHAIARGVAAVVLCGAALGASAQLAGENVLVPRLPDFKVGYETKTAQAMITEWVRTNETVDAWTEMATVQVFVNASSALTTTVFRDRILQVASQACPGGEMSDASIGTVNGYPSVQWSGRCPSTPKSGSLEYGLYKAVRGKSTMYYVHREFRFDPSDAQLDAAKSLLAKVSVCDSEDATHACPSLSRVEP